MIPALRGLWTLTSWFCESYIVRNAYLAAVLSSPETTSYHWAESTYNSSFEDARRTTTAYEYSYNAPMGQFASHPFSKTCCLICVIFLLLTCCAWRIICMPNGYRQGSDLLDGVERTTVSLPTGHIDILHSTFVGSGNFAQVNLVRVLEKKRIFLLYTKSKEFTAACKTAIWGENFRLGIESLKVEIGAFKVLGTHPFIVPMFMANHDPTRGQVCLLLEYCSRGSLLDFIRRRNVDTSSPRAGASYYERIVSSDESTALKWCYQIAKAVLHINSKGVIHRDIAARNILLDDNLDVKVSDFGLAIVPGAYSNPVLDTVCLPSQWLAYESMTRGNFSSKSDVWSCGVTFWEIFSQGQVPYEEGNCEGFSQIIGFLEDGRRLEKPAGTSEDVYTVMGMCWKLNPEERISITELTNEMAKLQFRLQIESTGLMDNDTSSIEVLSESLLSSSFDLDNHSGNGELHYDQFETI